jgi:hypothetical protein
MGLSPSQGTEFHDRDEARQVQDFRLGILAIRQAGQVEELGTLVNLGPKPLLQPLLGLSQLFGTTIVGLEFWRIQMSQDTHDAGESVNLEHIKKFKCFLDSLVIMIPIIHNTHHFKAKTSIHGHEHQISHLGNIDHGIDIIGTLDEC